MKLNRAEFRDKVLGCWLGKNVGGTLGAPFEWQRQVNQVTFYTQPNLNGQPLPNDDLDLQLLWLCALEERGLGLTAHQLAEYWLTYVTPHWAEYGIAKTNLRQGLPPPLSGSFRNEYQHSCGAYIRSEIWACIYPGAPRLAARAACEDAMVDHGGGEGTLAEIFMAALESAAFVLPALRDCIAVALSFIPPESGVARAARTTLECFDAGQPWLVMRDEVLRLHRGRLAEFMTVSAADRDKGFATGALGYDVPSNIAFTLAGLLWGGEDFGQVQCLCVNLGEDTDCTAATAGSVWGILHGAKALPSRWLEPIGRGIRTACLNLGELGYFGNQLPQTVDELTDRTVALAEQAQFRHPQLPRFTDSATTPDAPAPDTLAVTDSGRAIWGTSRGPRYDFDSLSVTLDYGADGPLVRPGVPKPLRVTITNSGKIQLNLALRWRLPADWQVAPGLTGYRLLLPPGLTDEKSTVLEYQFTLPVTPDATMRGVLEITVAGRATTALVPLVLINGALYPDG